ncbi:MAG: winged helix-turn-helix transcriptional regulator [Candidatus Aenigmarchaeota archaeon]|nr:winged helix-turn-helix transcriptional regulator [Candidatus Aenigmarchaeota archaeon]
MSNDTDKKILEFLSKQQWPTTTEDMAKALEITWHTAQVHLMRMYAEGKVMYRKVGRQNQWWINKNYKKNMGK